ncbi:uncharacterized protein [Misgurnus anguillicaudatus]|uniref:uncharacterized protein n=1 Tax=Misgurnus anguillicaudatus TaxID=75329 RepID=UPI003CCF13BE
MWSRWSITKHSDGGDVEGVDFVLPGAVLTSNNTVRTTGLLLDVMNAAGGSKEGEVTARDEPNSSTVFVNKEESDGGDVGVVGFVLPNAVLTHDTVQTTGCLSNVMRAGSSNQVRGEEFSPTYGGVESVSEKTKKKGAFKKAAKAIKRPFQSLWKTKVENIVLCQELDADPGIPEPKADVDCTRDKPKARISQDQHKQKGAKFPFFDWLRRGKVEPMPSPQPEAVAARPDEWDDADLGNSQSKTNVGPDKPNALAKIRQFFNRLRRNDGDLVVPSARQDADTANPVSKDDADLASPSVDIAALQEASVPAYIGLNKTNKQPKLKAVSSPDTKDDADLASTFVADAELHKASVPAYIGLNKTNKQPELKAVSSPDTKDDADLASTFVADAELQKASVPAYIGLKKTNKQPELKAVSSPDTKDDADLASTSVVDAELQKASVPAYIGLKGCENHNLDLKNSKQFKLKAASNPDPNVPDNPGQKSSRNPRPKVKENPGQKSARNPGPKVKENPRQKLARNPRPAVAENHGQKSARNPRRKVKENPGQKLARNLRPEVEENPTLKVAKEPEPKVEEIPTLSDFHSKYEANLIDRDSGKFFKGIRKADGKEVAIKFVNIESHTKFVSVPGYSKPLPEKVAVMLKLREAPECPYVIQMYDWYEMDNKFILVFEYLTNCDKLWTYIRHRRKLKEDKARYLLVQLLRAVKHCLDNGVLHRSIRSPVILVEKSSLHLKLCDFTCGTLVGSDGYSTTFNGYKHAASPEDWNVCQLSFLLYEMLNGQEIYPAYCTSSEEEFKFYNPFVSRDAFDLIHWGIGMPEDRPTIHQFLAHDWFKDEGLLDINPYEQPAVNKTFEDDWTTKEWRRKLKALKEERRTFIKKKGL